MIADLPDESSRITNPFLILPDISYHNASCSDHRSIPAGDTRQNRHILANQHEHANLDRTSDPDGVDAGTK